jgi:uncharacterized damage-inducible protein DinB
MANHEPEAWLRGPLAGVSPVVMPLFFTFAQVQEDLERHTAGLTADDVWRRIGNIAPLGFHLRHIPGSADRLVTYLEERSLSEEQFEDLKQESLPGADAATLLGEMEARFEKVRNRLKKLSLDDLQAPRYIGRKRLPTTVLGLLVHISEHTQRHLGQAITTTKLLKGSAE